MIEFFLLILAMFVSGTCGRMGGAGKEGHWYDWMLDTKWRDWGCSAIVVAVVIMFGGWVQEMWWAYLLVFLFHWGAFSTYWDSWFGYDNFWFSGMIVGLALSPILLVFPEWWPVVLLRTAVLALVWWALNKFLPQRIWIWGRDVVEEFSRYAVSL